MPAPAPPPPKVLSTTGQALTATLNRHRVDRGAVKRLQLVEQTLTLTGKLDSVPLPILQKALLDLGVVKAAIGRDKALELTRVLIQDQIERVDLRHYLGAIRGAMYVSGKGQLTTDSDFCEMQRGEFVNTAVDVPVDFEPTMPMGLETSQRIGRYG